MKYHPLSELFPLVEGEEFDRLSADIKANGLLEPIWTYEDKILDGRNRWLACKNAGVEPKTREYKGHDPVSFVVSMNIERRQPDAQSARRHSRRNTTDLRGGSKRAGKDTESSGGKIATTEKGKAQPSRRRR